MVSPAAEREEAPVTQDAQPGALRQNIHVVLAVAGMVAVMGFVSGSWAGLLLLVGLAGALLAGAAFSSLFAARGKEREVSVSGPVQDGRIDAAVEQLPVRNNELARFADIHDALGDIAVVRDITRRIVHANLVFQEMTGCTAPVGMTCEETGIAFRPGDEVNRFDVEIATPYGQRIFVWHDVVARDPLTGRYLIHSIARDVTGERQAAAARDEARIRAENASAAKSRLLSTVSHEIRQPLGGILGMGKLLEKTPLTQEQKNYLDGIGQSGEALAQLVEDLLDFSTLEAGRFRLAPKAENPRQLLESVTEMLAHRAHGKGIEVASTVDSSVPDHLDFDAARLRQVLFNIIGNAVKFTAKGGVLAQMRMDGADLVISVTDSGPGMDEQALGRIFGEFEQAGSQEQRSQGTGLGLAISARIMREFGGSLVAESRPGEGSTFIIRFRPGRSGGGMEPSRMGTLSASRVLLIAPDGPASRATMATISALGGACIRVSSPGEMLALGDRLKAMTDIIVDHRLAPVFAPRLAEWPSMAQNGARKTLLVNAEERGVLSQGDYDAWLIRPLREKSLADVLGGRMKGIEKREAVGDNHPGFGFARADTMPAIGLDVLVAEDDPVNARMIRAVLEKTGHKVRQASDFGTLLEALDPAAGDSRPDIVITDLNMPGGEGLDVLARICEGGDGAHVPVVVISGDTSDATRRAALLNGASAVLAKPVDPRRLVEELNRLAFRQTPAVAG